MIIFQQEIELGIGNRNYVDNETVKSQAVLNMSD